jgi:hypothetical protein
VRARFLIVDFCERSSFSVGDLPVAQREARSFEVNHDASEEIDRLLAATLDRELCGQQTPEPQEPPQA